MLHFKCCSELNIASAFYTCTADKVVTVSAYFNPFFISFNITFILRLDFCNVLLDQFMIVFISALEQKTSFALSEFHYLSTMNLTTLQEGIVAIKPSAVSLKSLNAAVFTTSLFSNVLWSSILPVIISAFTDFTSESAI